MAIKLLSVRFADAEDDGMFLDMYSSEAIGVPSVALHLAIQAHVGGKA